MKRKIGEIITIQDDDDFIDIKKCFINNLPNEILLIIFDFLDSIELSKFLIVCKLWKKVINNTNLMKTLKKATKSMIINSPISRYTIETSYSYYCTKYFYKNNIDIIKHRNDFFFTDKKNSNRNLDIDSSEKYSLRWKRNYIIFHNETKIILMKTELFLSKFKNISFNLSFNHKDFMHINLEISGEYEFKIIKDSLHIYHTEHNIYCEYSLDNKLRISKKDGKLSGYGTLIEKKNFPFIKYKIVKAKFILAFDKIYIIIESIKYIDDIIYLYFLDKEKNILCISDSLFFYSKQIISGGRIKIYPLKNNKLYISTTIPFGTHLFGSTKYPYGTYLFDKKTWEKGEKGQFISKYFIRDYDNFYQRFLLRSSDFKYYISKDLVTIGNEIKISEIYYNTKFENTKLILYGESSNEIIEF
jgi:hypothetical protein